MNQPNQEVIMVTYLVPSMIRRNRTTHAIIRAPVRSVSTISPSMRKKQEYFSRISLSQLPISRQDVICQEDMISSIVKSTNAFHLLRLHMVAIATYLTQKR